MLEIVFKNIKALYFNLIYWYKKHQALSPKIPNFLFIIYSRYEGKTEGETKLIAKCHAFLFTYSTLPSHRIVSGQGRETKVTRRDAGERQNI